MDWYDPSLNQLFWIDSWEDDAAVEEYVWANISQYPDLDGPLTLLSGVDFMAEDGTDKICFDDTASLYEETSEEERIDGRCTYVHNNTNIPKSPVIVSDVIVSSFYIVKVRKFEGSVMEMSYE